MKYELAPDIDKLAWDIVGKVGLYHIKLKRVVFVRSRGSKARRTLARIHGLPKIMQLALGTKAVYAVELISENFDKLDEKEKVKTVIHELMHIPKCFGGGFRGHRNYVNRKTVDEVFKIYSNACFSSST